MNDMKPELWSRLPVEIVDRLLRCLPAPVLCRFRTVDKRWDKLICSSEFGAEWLKSASQDADFLVSRYTLYYDTQGRRDEPFGEKHGWSILDGNARKWYTMEKDGQEIFDGCARFPLVAMAGGLVCQVLQSDAEDMAPVSVFVSNPIAKTSILLPWYPFVIDPDAARLLVEMVVDHDAQCFKVFVMEDNDGGDDVELIFMQVYDSKTNVWRAATNPPKPERNDNEMVEVECSIIYAGRLYILICCGGYWLWSYNYVEGTWDDPGVVSLIDVILNKPSMVVCDERLFLTSWVKEEGSDCVNGQLPDEWKWSYQINEIHVEDGTCGTVFHMTAEEIAQVFEVPAECLARYHGPEGWYSTPFSLEAFGFHKYIELISYGFRDSKVTIVYYPNTSLWENRVFPSHPSIPFPQDGHVLSFGHPMNLLLPASTHWVENEPEEGSL